jgi:HEAT repeat protein
VKLLGSAGKDQTWVSEALRERLPGALPLLAAELENEWDAGDLAVVRFLERLGADAMPAAPSLVKALERLDEEESAAFSLSFALLEIDPHAHELVRPLLRSPVRAGRLNALGVFCMSDTEELRAQAAEYLGRLGSAGRGAIPHLEAALRSRHAGVRMAAASALGRLRRAH